jgi:hypothetical protein
MKQSAMTFMQLTFEPHDQLEDSISCLLVGCKIQADLSAVSIKKCKISTL